MKKINWGIIGLGKMAAIFAEDLIQVEASQLYAVASRNQIKANQFALEFNVKKAYSSYEKLINDPNVDVVYIATPNHAHFELTQMCLQAQKNVLCEKPMCLTLTQTKTLVKEAKLQNRFLMEAI